MADLRFFHRAGPFTVSDIAQRVGAELPNSHSPDLLGRVITDVAPLETAGETDLSFVGKFDHFNNKKYVDQLAGTRAGACILPPELLDAARPNCAVIISKNPYKTFARVAQLFYPDARPEPMIAPTAHIDVTATIGDRAHIAAGVVIGPDVTIGDDVWIEPGAVIGRGVQMGDTCRIGPNATVSHAIMGNRVRLYPGVRVGQDGFGFAIDPSGHVKVPQLGRVMIGDDCEIGANTCIDRGTMEDTVIGIGTWIDNLVQIGHNVKIGRGCIIVSQVGIAGSTVIDDFVALGGQVGVAGHLHIGNGAQIAAQSGVMSDIPAGETYMGYPALPKTQFMRHIAYLNRATKRPPKSS